MAGGLFFCPNPTTARKTRANVLDRPRRREAADGSYLTQIKVRTSRDFLLLSLSAAVKCEATDEICPACAQRYRRNNLVQHSDESPKLSLVRNI